MKKLQEEINDLETRLAKLKAREKGIKEGSMEGKLFIENEGIFAGPLSYKDSTARLINALYEAGAIKVEITDIRVDSNDGAVFSDAVEVQLPFESKRDKVWKVIAGAHADSVSLKKDDIVRLWWD